MCEGPPSLDISSYLMIDISFECSWRPLQIDTLKLNFDLFFVECDHVEGPSSPKNFPEQNQSKISFNELLW